MTPQADGSFSFTLYGVSDPVEYYVSAAFTESEKSSVEVVIPAQITSIAHEYVYPDWTGLEPTQLADATTITAVAGTVVDITFETDKPLQKAAILHDDVEVAAEAISDTTYKGSITIENDGEYSLLELQDGAGIPLSPKHRITVTEDAKPTIAFNLPGGDWSATPIEEVAVAVEAQDDFAVESVELNYSVNGGPWEKIQLDETNQFEHLFMLEEFYSETGGPLLPGDLISYYAEAKDREQSVSTDMLFIDVRPFERRFTQSQQSGGGGGGGQQQQEQEISQRQKEILVSTFNLIRESKNEEASVIDPTDTATLLSDLQNTLADQANKLAQRAEARQLLNEDPDVARFVEYMQEAAESMQPSAQSLALLNFEEAVTHQQRALQYLKRAESVFNDITISQNNSNGGGGGGGASQDMAEMYELEMDLAKNQYETPDSVPESSSQQETSDDAFEKLKELARRQQQLAEAAAQKDQLSEAERWQQEKLRRELEELQRELEQLQREQASNDQQGQQGSQSQGQQSGQQSGEQSGQQSGEQSGQQQQADGSQSGDNQGSESQQQAMQSLEDAIQELKNTEENAANLTPEERRQAMQNASDKLRESLEQTADERQQQLQQELADVSDAVRDLSQQQQETSAELRDAMKRALEARRENRFESGLDSEQERRLAEQKRQMRRDIESIREDIEDASNRFAEQAPLTTERLEQTLEALDYSEVAELMGTSGDMIEEGMAPQAALREERISNALNNLQTDLFESSSLAAAETGTEGDSEPTVADATRAIQQLRQALTEALAQGGEAQGGEGTGEQTAELQQLDNTRGNGQGGQQSDSDQQGQGQQEGQGEGQGQQEGDSQQGQSGSRGNGQGGTNLSSSTNTWGPATGEQLNGEDTPINDGQVQLIEESVRQLQDLTNSQIPELSEQSRQNLQELSEQLQTRNDAENNRRIEADVRLLLRQLEQLELQIYNDSKEVQVTRSKQRVSDPEGFDSQTADYFRRLSEEPAGS